MSPGNVASLGRGHVCLKFIIHYNLLPKSQSTTTCHLGQAESGVIVRERVLGCARISRAGHWILMSSLKDQYIQTK